MKSPYAYCFFQDIEPRDPMVARFDRDYLLHAVHGALDVEIDGKRWLLPKSFAAWVPAGTTMRVSIKRPVTSCSILARPGFARGMPDKPVAFQMSHLAREMAKHCQHWGETDTHPPEAPVFFSALLSLCASLISGSLDVQRPTTNDQQLVRAIEYIETHYERALATADVAKAAALSERSLQRRFQAEFGVGWRQVMTRIRMINAVAMLCEGTASISEVSLSCGYSSPTAFGQNFKAFAGETPSAFRQRVS